MFNHARTLLINLDGNKSPGPDYLAEELIPRGYRALELPTYLDRLRTWLFGATPDRAMLNYRTRQLLAMIHATELEEFIYTFDSRITYDIHNEGDLVRRDAFRPVVEQYSGTPANLTIVGQPNPPDAHGRLRYDFDVDVLLGNTIEIKKLTPQSKSQILDLTLTNGLSPAYSLGDVGWKFRINTDSPGASWKVSGYLRPQWPLGAIASAIEKVGEPVFLELFGVAPKEPMLTFQNLWWTHLELPYRLGGLVLALIYRTEEVRRRG